MSLVEKAEQVLTYIGENLTDDGVWISPLPVIADLQVTARSIGENNLKAYSGLLDRLQLNNRGDIERLLAYVEKEEWVRYIGEAHDCPTPLKVYIITEDGMEQIEMSPGIVRATYTSF